MKFPGKQQTQFYVLSGKTDFIFHSVSALCDMEQGWLLCEIVFLKVKQKKKEREKRGDVKDGFLSGRFIDNKKKET